jgi:GTP pyrophosphokinase
MSPTVATNSDNGSDQHAVVVAVRDCLEGLPARDGLSSAIDEGRHIAEIVAPLGLPDELLAAVHAYPLLRGGFLTINTLKNNNLESISQFIIGLEQLDQFSLPEHWQPGEALAVQQSEALRKMLLAVVSDVRLVLVRIAEQLYRLRKAKTASREKQKALALEAREIYAALANRLGVWQLKWELEDLSFRYLEPEAYLEIARTLKEELDEQGITATISGRPKHIYSIWRKMQKKDRGIESLYDIRAVRILVDDISDCYAALGVVHNLWSYIPGEFDDYIAHPKENNYQSLHTAVVGPEGKTVEVQIRTHEMHRYAELGVAAHWRYKEGGGSPAAFDQKIQFLRQLLEPASDGTDLLDQIRDDFFEDRVYAVSPKGDVVELPANATPLDFAYHVHTQVGHRCRGAKVNGRIVPLTYHVENGDQIEIITGSQSKPSRDWLSPKLGYLAGARARAKVRNWFRHQDRDQHQRQGREILDRELARLGARDVPTDRIAKQLKLKDTEALCIGLGAGDLHSAAIATALQNLRGIDLPARSRRRTVRKKPSQADKVAVSGIGDLMCNFARCCRPVPPESIVGYITQGRGVSIHRIDCPNALRLRGQHPERFLEVGWGGEARNVFDVDIAIRAYDRPGLLRDVSTVLSNDRINVIAVDTRSDPASSTARMTLRLQIENLEQLSRALDRIGRLSSVIRAFRKPPALARDDDAGAASRDEER